MLEFKLQLYFEEYKDKLIISTTKFKELFVKKHGEFVLLPELVNMIIKYQYKKYGNLLQSGSVITRNVKKGTYNQRERARINNRFGTKEERLRRKIMEAYK